MITTDAMDMKAIRQGQGLVIDAIAAARAGVDLLLLSANAHDQKAVYDGLLQAVQRGLIDHAEIQASAGRVLALKAWCAQVAPARPPSLDIVNGSEHRALADEIAARSITLVRDDARQLPLQLSADARVAVVVPVPRDLTPADTSSYEKPALADSLRAYFAQVDEFSVMIEPSESDVAALRHSLADYDTVLVGTINATAHPGQVALVNTLLQDHIKTIVVALRMPYDLQAFPQAPSFLCTYSLLPPSMRALARVLVGEKASQGKLPVSIPGLYPIGHGM